MRKLIVLVIVLAAVGAGGYAWWRLNQAEAQQDHLTLYGNVDIREVALSFNGQEHIARVLVEEGAQVARGDMLAELDSDRLRKGLHEANARVAVQEALVRRLEAGTRPQEIERARSDVEAAQAQKTLARRTYHRKRDLVDTGAVTQLAVDDARAALDVATARLRASEKTLELAEIGPRQEDIDQARASLRAARAKRARLRLELADTKLRAPAAGIIRNRILEPGDCADPRMAVFTLARMDPKWVRTYLPERELGRVKPGMAATVHTDSHPDKAYEGWVGFISPTAEFTPKNVETPELRTALVYETRVHVRDPDNELRLGMPATVRIAYDAPADAAPHAGNTGSATPPDAAPPAETSTGAAPDDR